MDQPLIKFLQGFRDNSEYYTHTSQLIPTVGKYRIERKNSEEFWKLYCDRLYEEKETFMCGLAERPNEYMPVLVDVDIALPYDEEETKLDKHFYTKEHVEAVIKIYIDQMKFILQEYKEDDLVCFVLEKEKPYISGARVKNGFHLHFPFMFLSNVDQDMHLIPRVIQDIDNLKLFEDIGYTHSGDVIDKSCSKKHWLMYGSRKDRKLTAYHLTKIYDHNCKEIDLSTVVKDRIMFDSVDKQINFNENPLEYYLPMILSIHPQNRETYEAKNTIEVIPKNKLIKSADIKRVYENMTVSQAVEIASKLVPLLSERRASNYNEWMEIGWILYNIGDGCREALNLWIEFSKKTSQGNYSEAGCVYRWNKMSKANYTIGSLKYYASQDNPEMYNRIQQEEQRQHIQNSLLGGHADIAKQLYDRYGSQFVCAGVGQDIWYEYKDHRWQRIEKGITLRSKIGAEIIPRYAEESRRLCSEISREDDNAEKALKTQSQVNKIISSLKCATFKNNIMKECQELFYNPQFLDKLDSNIYLMGFTNGVLDLRIMEFREGRPDDYISMTTGYDYKDFDREDPEIAEIKDLLLKIFPNQVLRRYFLEYTAKLLKAGNFSKTFVVMTGVGDNGKSIIIDLLRKVLGQYMAIPPTTLITGKETQSASASPDLEMTKNTRFIALAEPDGKDVITTGVLKRLTGNDEFYTRGLFKEGKNVVATFKMTLICNKLPRLSADDQAVWNRVRVLPFESFFPKDSSLVPQTFEEQLKKKIFYRDNTLNEKLPYMKQAFMWLMFETYREIQQFGESPEPDIVTNATALYRQNNDMFLQFVNEKIKKDQTPNCPGLTLQDAYAEFRLWFHDTFSGIKLPSKNDLKEDLYKRFGIPRGIKWKDYRLKTMRDEEEEGSLITLGEDDFTDTTDDEF